MIKIPEKIEPCPIVEAIVEIRFDSNIPNQAIIGMFYEKLKKIFPTFVKLDILTFPEEILEMDQNLKFKPHVRLLKNTGFLVQVGPKSFSIVNANKYLGWISFKKEIAEIIDRIESLNIFGNFIRLGIRYINLFEFDIFSKLRTTLSDKSSPLYSDDMRFFTSIKEGEFVSNVRITNNGTVKILDILHTGSLIDIDTFIDFKNQRFSIDYFNSVLENGHLVEKNTFFSMLSDEFIKTLNPKYSE